MDTKKSILSTFFDKLKKNRKLEIGLYIGLGLLALVIYLFASTGTKSTCNKPVSAQNSGTTAQYTAAQEKVESKLSGMLSQIRGAGKVTVMITYDTGTRIVPAMSTTTQSNHADKSNSNQESSQPATVTQDGDEVPIVLTEVQPVVRGVIVIAEGAADINVRLNLTHAVETVLGVTAECIEVFEMDGFTSDK